MIHPTNNAHRCVLPYLCAVNRILQTVDLQKGLLLRKDAKRYTGSTWSLEIHNKSMRLNSMWHSSSLPTNSTTMEEQCIPNTNWNMTTQAMVPRTAYNFLEVFRTLALVYGWWANHCDLSTRKGPHTNIKRDNYSTHKIRLL